MKSTPASLGYRMPAEWEEHDATWLSWPKNAETFPPSVIGEVEKAYATVVDALSEGEEVRVLVDDDGMEKRARSMLKAGRNVSFLRLKTADVWVRDYAPTCVRGKDVALVKWTFDAWGGKYDDLKPDDGAGRELARVSGLRTFDPGMVLEGGSVDVNGRGTVLTTEQCLLNPNRNPGLRKRALEYRLRENLGVKHVVWLGSGILGDDTDGHVDDIARFVAPDVVALAWEGDSSDPNHAPLEENLRRLRDSLDQDGEIFDVVTIPMPPPVFSPYGRLPASHLNFYIGNAAVLVPTFGSPTDRNAMGTLRPYFPDRKVVGIDCNALVYGLGTLHCVTQQVPAVSR
jgi:agmatine deiminase